MLRIGCLAALLVAACSAEPPTVSAAAAAPAAQRIVTLAPHLTELVYTAGAGARLVGVVAWSDFPPEAAELPLVGDAFRVDLERLAALEPDLVLAWDSGNPAEVIEQLERHGYRVVALATRTLDEVADNLEQIGRLAGTAAIARERAQHYRDRLDALRAQYGGQPSVSAFYEISPTPLYTVGRPHPITGMIAACGGRNIFADIDAMAPVVSVEDVLLRDPQVMLAGPPPGTDTALQSWRRWPHLRAVRDGHLYTVDPSLVARASTRILEGLVQICTALQRARSAMPTQGDLFPGNGG